MAHLLSLLIPLFLAANPLGPGDHERKLKVDDLDRRYFVHVPPNLDPQQSVPVVLIFHGAGMNGRMMPGFCGMNDKADAADFVAVYPNGTGVAELLLVFNAAGTPEKPYGSRADDVKFVGALLDDLGTVLRIDSDRVYATGFSNGAMLCYRLAAEIPDRIAAIAPVSGTQGRFRNCDRLDPCRFCICTARAICSFRGTVRSRASRSKCRSCRCPRP